MPTKFVDDLKATYNFLYSSFTDESMFKIRFPKAWYRSFCSYPEGGAFASKLDLKN